MESQKNKIFDFKKTGPIFKKPSKMPKPGPYYPSLVSMKNLEDFPFDFALYFSTDHHHKSGGIYLYLCNGVPSDPKNWISYDQAVKDGKFDYITKKPRKNPIFIDHTYGSHHTETPYANVVDGKVYLSYHYCNSQRQQATLMATSDDGINFKRISEDDNAVILKPIPGHNHTGYFRWAPNIFHKIDYKFVGYSLYGGGDDYHSAMWGSNDAISWDRLQIFTPMEGYAMDGEDMIMIWHGVCPESAMKIGNDEYVMIASGGNRASGGTKRTVELYEIFVAGDGKTLTRQCRKILAQGSKKSLDSEEVAEATIAKIGDTWHLLYTGTSHNSRKNVVMGAIGNFNKEADLPQKLASEDLQQNFYDMKKE